MADQTLSPSSGQENKVVRRNRPGTKAKDMYNWPEQDFNDMETVLAGESMFGCQYWCAILINVGAHLYDGVP